MVNNSTNINKAKESQQFHQYLNSDGRQFHQYQENKRKENSNDSQQFHQYQVNKRKFKQ